MRIADAQRTLQLQLDSGLPFGEAARKLGVATAADVRFALAQQFSLHSLERGDPAIDPEVIAAFDPSHEIAEHMRMLRGQVMVGTLSAPGSRRAIAVLGPGRGAGRTFIAANLATVFAQLGHKTLLLDADLVHPRIHLLFRLQNRSGLSTILAQRAKLDVVRQVPSLPSLGVLVAGPRPPNPNDLLARPVFGMLLRECAKIFDVIVVDTPAASRGTGATTIAAAAGSAILVTRRATTQVGEARALVSELEGNGTPVLGAVFNRA
jgi:chain length determinant protein tyrosine kinase EpsG